MHTHPHSGRRLVVSFEGFNAMAARLWVENMNESFGRMEDKKWTIADMKRIGSVIRVSLTERELVAAKN